MPDLRLQQSRCVMSEASVDVVVEVIESFYQGQAAGNDQFLWNLHVKWYGVDQVYGPYPSAGEAVNEAVRQYPQASIRVEVIPLGAGEIVSA